MNALDGKIRDLSRDESGKLHLTLEDGTVEHDVEFVSIFPLKDPEHFVSVAVGEGDSRREIGILKDIEGMDRDRLQLVRDYLAFRHFLPQITDVRKVVRTGGLTEWHVATDKGDKVFYLTSGKDSMTVTDAGMILITDTDGGRYCITNANRLRNQARLIVERELP